MPYHAPRAHKNINARRDKTIKNQPDQSGSSTGNIVNPHHIISDTTYCSALRHGFDGGDPVDEWLMVEEEVDHMLYGKEKIDDDPE